MTPRLAVSRIALVVVCMSVCLAPAVSTFAAEGAKAAAAITGTVVDAGGKPVAGAAVVALPVLARPAPGSKRPEVQKLLEATTGADGAFRFEAAGAESFAVRAEAKDFAPGTASGKPGETLTVTLAAGVALEGAVYDERSGRPLGGADVRVENSWTLGLVVDPADPDRFVPKAKADGNGRFRIARLAPGDATVSATAEGRARATRRVDVGASASDALVFYLKGGAAIVGKVTGPGGAAVKGARVMARVAEMSRGANIAGMAAMNIAPVRTDAAGAFEVTGLPPGTYQLATEHDDYAPAWVGGIRLGEGRRSSPVAIALDKGIALTGTLRDRDEAFRGALAVSIVYERGRDEWVGARRGVDRAGDEIATKDGVFTIDRLPAGVAARIALRPEGYAEVVREKISLAPGRPVDLGVLQLERGAVIRGAVTGADGAPVAGADITARAATMQGRFDNVSGKTAADGTFTLGGVQTDLEYTVIASKSGSSSARVAKVKADGEPVALAMTARGAVKGVVVTGDPPKPLSTFSVEASRPAGDDAMGFFSSIFGDGRQKKAIRDASGAFTFDTLDAGTTTITVSADGYVPVRKEKLELAPGETLDLGTIVLERGATLRGSVVDKKMKAPVGGAAVDLTEAGLVGMMRGMNPEARSRRRQTGPDGRFTLTGLPVGRHTVEIEHENFATAKATVDVAAGQLEVETTIELTPGGVIEGVIRDKQGFPAKDMTVVATAGVGTSLRLISMTDEAGYYRIEHVPPGTYMIVAQPVPTEGSRPDPAAMMGKMQMASTAVEDGRTVVLNLPASQGQVTIKGRVLRGRTPLEARLYFVKGSPGASASIDLATANSGGDGSYEAKLSGTGRYQVRVQRTDKDFTDPGVGILIDVPEGQQVVEKDLVLPEAYVAGRVVDPETGQAPAGARVALVRLGADGEMDARDPVGGATSVASDGAYRIEGLRKGTYRLVAGADGFANEVVTPLDLDDDTKKDGMDFSLRRAAPFTVKVVGDGERPVQGAMVMPADASVMMTGGGQLDAMTDAEGIARLRRLGEGTHDLAAVAPGYAPVLVRSVMVGGEAPDGGKEITLTLERGGGLEARVIDAQEKGQGGLSLRIREQGGSDLTMLTQIQMIFSSRGFGGLQTDAAGIMRLDALAPGTYELQFLREDAVVGRAVAKVKSGETARVEIKLP